METRVFPQSDTLTFQRIVVIFFEDRTNTVGRSSYALCYLRDLKITCKTRQKLVCDMNVGPVQLTGTPTESTCKRETASRWMAPL